VAGSADLIAQTMGPNSPFNIAKKIYLTDFSTGESKELIDRPFKDLGIQIKNDAKEELLSQISGHPQLLQQACHILVENTSASNPIVTMKDVQEAIDALLDANETLKRLEQEIKSNNDLKLLLESILKGNRSRYFPYKEFALTGAGSIAKSGRECVIRNKVYEKYIKKILIGGNDR
jgi:hypothetical protein